VVSVVSVVGSVVGSTVVSVFGAVVGSTVVSLVGVTVVSVVVVGSVVGPPTVPVESLLLLASVSLVTASSPQPDTRSRAAAVRGKIEE
jgi:hypothetical protein